jgi:hypothetical protein
MTFSIRFGKLQKVKTAGNVIYVGATEAFNLLFQDQYQCPDVHCCHLLLHFSIILNINISALIV